MNARNILMPALSLAILVLVLHLTALEKHLYWHNFWFHFVIHFLAGLTISLTAIFVFFRMRPAQPMTKRSISLVAFFTVFFFAIVWEVFEYYSGLIYITGIPYVIYTIRDLLVGLFGGAFGAIYTSIYINQR